MTSSDPRGALAAAHAPPALDGRYELGEVHGRGGSATLYRAWDRRDARIVALKLFARGVHGPDRHRQHRELATLARLDHPGLVTLLDAGADDDRAFLVMEFVDGPSLADALAEGPWPAEQVERLGARLAAALAYVHAHGVTHRDVKPANVLLDGAGEPLLADFGIALLVDTTRVTATDAIVGTAAYLAPEQLRDAEVDPAADVYALGLVLLEAVTGLRAFVGTSAEAILARLVAPPTVPATVPAPLACLLGKMTADDPDLRPTAAEVAQVLSGAASPTVPPPRRPGRVGWTWRRVAGWSLALAAVVAGLVIAVWVAVGVPAGVSGPGGTVAPPVAAAPPTAPPATVEQRVPAARRSAAAASVGTPSSGTSDDSHRGGGGGGGDGGQEGHGGGSGSGSSGRGG
jgi:eukaryotic-like serine/threonine-protein kinase